MIYQARPISKRLYNYVGGGSNPLTSSRYDDRRGIHQYFWHGGPGPIYYALPAPRMMEKTQ